MWIIFPILIIIGIIVIKKNNSKENEIAKIVEAADSNDPTAKEKLSKYFDDGLTSEKYNEIRKSVYLPKANSGDSNAQYMMGLLSSKNRGEMEKWWTKAAENGNTDAMYSLSASYSFDIDEPLGLGVNEEKSRYWLEKAAETNPDAMCALGLQYSIEGKADEALELYLKASKLAEGKIKLKALTRVAREYGDLLFKGHDSEKEREFLLKALNVKPCPNDSIHSFGEEYADSAFWLESWYKIKYKDSREQGDLKNAAYCAVIEATWDSDKSDRLNNYVGVYTQQECNKWVEDARSFNFRLPY